MNIYISSSLIVYRKSLHTPWKCNFPMIPHVRRSVGWPVSHDFLKGRENEVLCSYRSTCFSRFHGYAYDGIWAIALAIHRVNDEARLSNQTMQDFVYR